MTGCGADAEDAEDADDVGAATLALADGAAPDAGVELQAEASARVGATNPASRA